MATKTPKLDLLVKMWMSTELLVPGMMNIHPFSHGKHTHVDWRIPAPQQPIGRGGNISSQ